MPRGPRRGTNSARRVQRKVEKTLLATHGGYAGPSLIESLETELLEAVILYLGLKDKLPGGISDQMRTARGRVSGLVTAVAIVRNAYTADDPQVIKALEREFIRHARAEMAA